MAEPVGTTPSSEPTPDPSLVGSVIPIAEHIKHQHPKSTPPQEDWTYVDFASIQDKVLRHLHRKLGKDNVTSLRVQIGYRDTIGLAVIGIVLKENIAHNWVTLNSDIETIARHNLRKEKPGFGLIHLAISYQLLPPVPLIR
jgi:hypothetical protein